MKSSKDIPIVLEILSKLLIFPDRDALTITFHLLDGLDLVLA